MRTEQIKALTGIRFFAALWVVLYHSAHANKPFLKAEHPAVWDVLHPLVGFGTQGVDLFFVLSGFVLTLNYLDQLGPRLDLRRTARFLWLRLARIWPAYLVVTLGAGALIWFRHHQWHSVSVRSLCWRSLLEQVLMVQQWTSPRAVGTSWAGPAWSLSAEWLAYLLFPLLALVALRLRHSLQTRWLFAGSVLALTPYVVKVLADDGITGPYTWVVRIIPEFVAGMLLCTAMTRLRLTPRQRAYGGLVAVLSVVAILAALLSTAFGAPRVVGYLVVVLFPVLLGGLAIGRGWLVDLLSTPALVLGGAISYALYLVHGPALHLYRDLTRYTAVAHLSRDTRYVTELVLIAGLVVVAWVIYRVVEEPSRRAMRRALDASFPPVEHPLVPAEGEHEDPEHDLAPEPGSRR